MKNNRTPAIAFSVSAIAVAFLLEATTYPVPLGVGQFNPVSYVLDSTSFWPADKRIPNRYVASGWIGEHISARTLSLGCANIQASKINAFLAWSARHCGNPVRNHEYTLVAHAGKERHLTWRVPQLERELQRQMAGSDIESAYRVLDRRFKALGFTFMRARMIRRGDMTSSLTEKIAGKTTGGIIELEYQSLDRILSGHRDIVYASASIVGHDDKYFVATRIVFSGATVGYREIQRISQNDLNREPHSL